jgi:predicted nucleic acid-binding protein
MIPFGSNGRALSGNFGASPRVCNGKTITVTATTGSESVVLDSSIWLEYLTDDAKAESFAPYLESSLSVLIPTIVLYEVRRVLLIKQSKTSADIFYSEALKRTIVPFDEVLALKAAELSIFHRLSMADAIIYATAKHYRAQFVTSDSHFANVPDVTLL